MAMDEDSDEDGQLAGGRPVESTVGSRTGSTVSLSTTRDDSSSSVSPLPWVKDDRTFISISALLNTPTRRFIPSRPARKDIPAIPPAAIEHIERSAFEPFMKKIGQDFLQFEKNKQVIYRQGTDDLSPRDLWRGTPDIASVPKIFFEEDFDLGNPRIFSLVKGTNAEEEDTVSEQIVQEKLSNYLDIVEANLVKEVSDRSVQFFAALTTLKGLEKEAKASIESTQRLKTQLTVIEKEKADKELKRLKLQQKREALVKLWRTVQTVSDVASAHTTIQNLLRQEDYYGALDLIDETRAILNGAGKSSTNDNEREVEKIHFAKIRILENMPTKLDETTKLIGKLLEQDLLNVLGADLQHSSEREDQIDFQERIQSIDIATAVSFVEQTGSIANRSLAKIEESLSPILAGLTRTDRLKDSIESYRELILREIRSMVRKNLPVSDSQDEADGQSASEKAVALAKSLKVMSHPDFLRLTTQTLDSLYNALDRLSLQVHYLKMTMQSQQDMASAKGPSASRASQLDEYISRELDDVLSSAVDLANLRCSKIVGVRADQHAKLPFEEFFSLYSTLLGFVVLCERITGKLVVGLRGAILTQAKSWLAYSHGQRLSRSAEAVSKETWSPIDLRASDLKLVQLIIALATQDALQTFESHSTTQAQSSAEPREASQKQITIDDHAYFIVPATLQMLALSVEYLQVLTHMPSLVSEIMNRLLEFLKQYNSRTCQMVLGAGALRSAGLKNITAKHLALASQSLAIVIALLPYMRETMRRFLSAKQAIVLTEFDRLKRDYQDHQTEIHAKLVSIMSDRMSTHCRSLLSQDWSLQQDDDQTSAYMEALVKETVLLHKVLAKYLPTQTLEFILHQVFAVLKNRLMETYQEVELKTTSGKKRMLNDARYFRERLSDLKGVSGPGSTVEAIVGEKTIARPEKIMDLTPTAKKNSILSSSELRKSMDRLRTTSFEIRRQTPDKAKNGVENPLKTPISSTPPFTTTTANGSTIDLIATSEVPKEEKKDDALIFDADVDKVDGNAGLQLDVAEALEAVTGGVSSPSLPVKYQPEIVVSSAGNVDVTDASNTGDKGLVAEGTPVEQPPAVASDSVNGDKDSHEIRENSNDVVATIEKQHVVVEETPESSQGNGQVVQEDQGTNTNHETL